MQFTKDTSKLLATIYKEYLERRQHGVSRQEAKEFSRNFYKNFDLPDEDVIDCLRELNSAHFVKMNISGSFRIEDTLIIQMENRFKSGALGVAKYLADLAAGLATGLVF